jgi:hypothetical protein
LGATRQFARRRFRQLQRSFDGHVGRIPGLHRSGAHVPTTLGEKAPPRCTQLPLSLDLRWLGARGAGAIHIPCAARKVAIHTPCAVCKVAGTLRCAVCCPVRSLRTRKRENRSSASCSNLARHTGVCLLLCATQRLRSVELRQYMSRRALRLAA